MGWEGFISLPLNMVRIWIRRDGENYIPDGGKSVGKDMEIQKSLVGMLFKGKDGERDI